MKQFMAASDPVFGSCLWLCCAALDVSLLPQEVTVIEGSESGGQLCVIMKWGFKRKEYRLAPLLSLNKDFDDI